MGDAKIKYPYNGNQRQCTICDYKIDKYNWLQVLRRANSKRDEHRINGDIYIQLK